MQFDRHGDEDLIYRDVQDVPERVQVIYRGEALSALPLVDRPRLFKAKVLLQVLYRQAALLAQPLDVAAGRREVDDRESG